MSFELVRHGSAFPSRGGAAIVQVDGVSYMFGGASREQEAFNDLWILPNDSLIWHKVDVHGDVPTCRSGHTMVVYKDCIILHGGIDYREELAYNDMYCYRISTNTWSYIGESGHEIKPRNSHSLAVLVDDCVSYLVVYGGADEDTGPLDDTYIALLPHTIEDGFFVNWECFPLTLLHPAAREMHATAYIRQTMIICGGKSISENLLGDLWKLTLRLHVPHTDGNHSQYFITSKGHYFIWENIPSLDQEPICSHSIVLASDMNLFLFGGFNGQALSNTLQMCDISSPIHQWIDCSLSEHGSSPPLFGHAAVLCFDKGGMQKLVIVGGISLDEHYNDTVCIRIPHY